MAANSFIPDITSGREFTGLKGSITSEVLDRLAAFSEQHAEPEICDHLYAVLEGELTVAWYDAFDGPLLVNRVVSEIQVKEFARGMGVEPTQWNAG